jgi:hypothetical protein
MGKRKTEDGPPSLARGSGHLGIFPDPFNSGFHLKGLHDPGPAQKSRAIN